MHPLTKVLYGVILIIALTVAIAAHVRITALDSETHSHLALSNKMSSSYVAEFRDRLDSLEAVK